VEHKLKIKLLRKLSSFRQRGDNNFYVLVIASIIVGFLTGLGAVILKNSVHFIHALILPYCKNNNGILYLFFPLLGMILTYFYLKYTRFDIRSGVPNLLFSISQNNGYVKPHNMFSSIFGAILTVGFGAPAGLESPNITTGGAIGSFISKVFKLSYRERILLLGVAATGTISAIFKAPITGIVFALEVVMIDLTSISIIPILLASITAFLTSYMFLGHNYLYPLHVQAVFELKEIPYYILMGIIMGFFALFFTVMYRKLKVKFRKIKVVFFRFLISGIILGLFVFLFPAIFAEGYAALNSSIQGEYGYLHQNVFFEYFKDNKNFIILLFLILAIVKAFTTALTVSAGGVGGFFTPILFAGANLGLFMSHLFGKLGIEISHENSALVAMGGLISAMMHAPLTGVFFIGEITGGYSLLLPLLITSSIAFLTIRIFQKHNFFSEDLAREKSLLTHHADLNILTILKLQKLIEVNFIKLAPNENLGNLVEAVKISTRDLFPVVDDENNFLGVISLNRIRKLMFKPELYDKILVTELMIFPDVYVELDEHLSEAAEQFEKTQRFNLLVLDKGKYVGFLSRSNFFLHYRKTLSRFSAH